MVNSSWTKGHVDSILLHSDRLLDFLHYLPPLFLLTSGGSRTPSRVVYPPCDTREMAAMPLSGRQRLILSVAQFRFGSSRCSYL